MLPNQPHRIQRHQECEQHDSTRNEERSINGMTVERVRRVVKERTSESRTDCAGEAAPLLQDAERTSLLVFVRDL